MAGGGSIKGVIGTVMWRYFSAARVEGFAIRRSASGQWSLVATIVPGTADAYKLSQSPLVFVAPTAKGEWSWPIVSCAVTRGELRAQLGPPNP